MSTQLPAHLLALFQSNPEAANIGSSIETNNFNTIRYTGSKFKLVKATGEEIAVPTPHLDIIVVGINEHKSHVVYAKAYDPKGEPEAPVWSSDDGTPVPVEHENKVISDYRRWAVLIVGHEDGGVFELRVSAASISNGDKYVTALRNNGVPVSAVVTRLTFDSAYDYPRLVFAPASYLDTNQGEVLGEILKSGKTQIAVAIGTNKRAAQLEAPKAQVAIEAPKPQDLAGVQLQAEPAKRGRKKAEPVTAPAANVFTLPQSQPSAAASTVIAPKPTDAGLDQLLANIMK